MAEGTLKTYERIFGSRAPLVTVQKEWHQVVQVPCVVSVQRVVRHSMPNLLPKMREGGTPWAKLGVTAKENRRVVA